MEKMRPRIQLTPLTEATVAEGAILAQRIMPAGAGYQDIDLYYPTNGDESDVAIYVTLEREEGPQGSLVSTIIKLHHRDTHAVYISVRLHGVCANLDLLEHQFREDRCFLRIHHGTPGHKKQRPFIRERYPDNPKSFVNELDEDGPSVPYFMQATHTVATRFLADEDVASQAPLATARRTASLLAATYTNEAFMNAALTDATTCSTRHPFLIKASMAAGIMPRSVQGAFSYPFWLHIPMLSLNCSSNLLLAPGALAQLAMGLPFQLQVPTPGLACSDFLVGTSTYIRTAVAPDTTISSDVESQCWSLAAPPRRTTCPPATAALIMATIRQHLRQSGVPATMPSLLAALDNLVVPADALTTCKSTSPASKGQVAAKRVVMSRGQRKKAQAQRKKERIAAALLAAGTSDEPCLEPTDLGMGSTAQAGSCITDSYRHSDPGCSGIPDMPPTRVWGQSNPGFASARPEHRLAPALSDSEISTLGAPSTFPRSQSLTDITCKQAPLPLTRSYSMADVATKAVEPLPRARTEPGCKCTMSLDGLVRPVTTPAFDTSEALPCGDAGDGNALHVEPVARLSLGQRKAAKAQRKKERAAAAALLASSPPSDMVPALPRSASGNGGCTQAVSSDSEVNINNNIQPVQGPSRRQRKRANAQDNKGHGVTAKVVARAAKPAPQHVQAVYLGKGATKKVTQAKQKVAPSLQTLASVKTCAPPPAAAPYPPPSVALQSTAAAVVKAPAPKLTASAGSAGSPQPQAPHGSVSQCQATSLADLTPIFSEVALDQAYRQLMSLQTATPAMERAVSKKAMAQSAATAPSTEQMRKASIAAARLKEEASLRDAFQAIRSPLYYELAHCNVSEAALCALPATVCV